MYESQLRSRGRRLDALDEIAHAARLSDAGAAHIAINFSGIQAFYEKHKDEIRFLSAPIRSVDKGLDTTWLYLKDPNGMIIELSEDNLGAR